MKKSVVVSALTVMTAISLVGCSSGSDSKDQGNVTTLDVFNIKTETAEQMENLVEMFEASHEDIQINMTTVGGGTDAAAALQAKFSSGDEPDIFMLGGLSDVQTWQHTLYDVGDTELADLAIEGTLEGATLDETVYAVPMNIEGYGWLVNQTIFEAAGVPVEEITSFADFKKAVETLDQKKEELGLSGVFAYSGGERWVSSQFSANFVAPEFHDSLLETYESPSLALTYNERMQEYADLAKAYNATSMASMDYSTSVEELFASEKVAIVHQGNWIVPTLNSLDESFASEKLAIVPMYVEDERVGKIVAGPSWYWGVNSQKDQAEIDASIEFLTWMYTDEEAMASIIDDFEFIPAYTNFDSENINDPLSQTIYTYLSDGLTVPWVHNSYPDGYGENVVGVQMQAYASDQISWDEFVDTLVKDWEQARGK